ncbi:hypothetical protein SAMN06269250_2339 [Spirosoma fluviale]|uniref:Uncharacterized protein n=1 Tax=Spirosoma fluviale TaxID=1597977 RepID=A0A286FIF7_9BACT|nr:hypothetical protein SAMN06269250_2339 [Spirosoma fluviale]
MKPKLLVVAVVKDLLKRVTSENTVAETLKQQVVVQPVASKHTLPEYS